ncbi:MAG: condensation domain-containing protein [Rhizonema sp. PD38]|nr:condensation domain-containing protein [Rhizonema sp. PD38]
MDPKNIEDIYTLSPTQQGILFHVVSAPNSGIYFDQQLCTLHGECNLLAFELAWQQVVARHSTLRTAFVWENLNKPLQIVYRRATLEISQYNWSKLSIAAQQANLQNYLTEDRNRGFNLSEPPLMRLAVIQIAENIHQLVWSSHHLVSDVWSDAILLKEVFALYEALDQGKSIDLQPRRLYRDYITWLKQQDLTEAETYWQQVLQGFRVPTPLGIDQSNINSHSPEKIYDQQQVQLSVAVTVALNSLAKHYHLTLNTLLIGAWAILLSQYSGNKDVLFGTVLSGRPVSLSGSESMTGLFVNTLPTRVEISPEDSLLPWLKSLQLQQIKLRQYEHTPLAQVQSWTKVPKGLPLFESIFVFQNSKVDTSKLPTRNLKMDNIRSFTSTNYPLTLIAVPGSSLCLDIIYDLRRFQPVTATKILSHFQEIINIMVIDPSTQLGNLIRMLDEFERKEKSMALEARQQLHASKLKSLRPKTIRL